MLAHFIYVSSSSFLVMSLQAIAEFSLDECVWGTKLSPRWGGLASILDIDLASIGHTKAPPPPGSIISTARLHKKRPSADEICRLRACPVTTYRQGHIYSRLPCSNMHCLQARSQWRTSLPPSRAGCSALSHRSPGVFTEGFEQLPLFARQPRQVSRYLPPSLSHCLHLFQQSRIDSKMFEITEAEIHDYCFIVYFSLYVYI